MVQNGRDESGQLYHRNRFYDPNTGRFTQEDPIGIAGGLNVYGFAEGDPVTYSDPYGLSASCCQNPLAHTLPPSAGLRIAAAIIGEETRPEPYPGSGEIRSTIFDPTILVGEVVAVGRALFARGAARVSARGAASVAAVAPRGGVFGYSGTVDDLLMPGGSPIGQAGSKVTIRELSGGAADAQAMFSQLSAGGTPVAGSYPGTLVRLPGGGTVGLRTVMSRSPNSAATIDVNIPNIPIQKIKFNP